MKENMFPAAGRLRKIVVSASAFLLITFSGVAFSADMDFNGIYRPQGTAPDIGACEYAGENYQAPPAQTISAPTNLRVVSVSEDG
jgi:hypothetical protein